LKRLNEINPRYKKCDTTFSQIFLYSYRKGLFAGIIKNRILHNTALPEYQLLKAGLKSKKYE
jgi:hypothetical protein